MSKSSDRPAAEEKDGGAAPLTSVRVSLPQYPHKHARVETVARPGLAREVLLDRAVPLLARARRLLDQYAEPSSTLTGPHRAQCARLADAIADLIGHSTTDQEPADELLAVIAEGTPARLTWDQLETLPRDLILPTSAMPTEPAVPAEPANVDLWAELPPCPMAPYAESSDPAAPEKDTEAPAELPRHDLNMPHHIGPAFASTEEMIAWERGVEGCPPGCPRRLAAEGRCSWCRDLLEGPPGLGCQLTGAHKVAARIARIRTGVPGLDRRDEQLCREIDELAAAGAALGKSSEPATPACTCSARPGQGHLLRCAVYR